MTDLKPSAPGPTDSAPRVPAFAHRNLQPLVAAATDAATALAAMASPLPVAPPAVAAVPLAGAALQLQAPADVTFRMGVYDGSWKLSNAAGGARAEAGGGDIRSFVIDMGAASSGENVAKGALHFDGTASLQGMADGTLAAEWSIVPDRDGEVQEAMVEARVPIGRIPGGFRLDGATAIAIPDGVPPAPRVFQGRVSRLELLDAGGAVLLDFAFPDAARILLQDNRQWGAADYTLRFFLAEGAVRKGTAYRMRTVVGMPGRAIAPVSGEPVRIEAGPDWIPCPPLPAGTDWIAPGSALDLSASMPRHEPAGAFGRVVVVGDHFELEGRPGEEIRFCGVNVVRESVAPDMDSAERFAANLARMGYNSVRLHHQEAPLLATRGEAAAADGGACLAVDPGALARFDALCAACIRHGIYLTTDLYVSRGPIAWRAVGIDRDGTIPRDTYKQLVAFHEGAFSNLVVWTRRFLGHVNPLTGRSFAEEPALATLALVNEGNLGNFGRDALFALPGVEEAWGEWLAGRGLEKPGPGGAGVPGDLYERPGPDGRLADEFALFLASREARLFRRLAAVVRDELGCRAPLSNLSSWYNPAAYSLVRAEMDYDDDHGYVDHPRFLAKMWWTPSTHGGGNPLLGGDAVPGYAWRRLFGKPFCVTEWNWSSPGIYRGAAGLVTGALGARQGWAGMWRFSWSHKSVGVEAPGNERQRYFDMHGDPAMVASDRATICLFGRGDLSPLPRRCAAPAEQDAAALRDGRGASRRLVAPAGAASGWRRRIGVRLADGAPPATPGNSDAALPDMAVHDPVRGTFAVSCPRTVGGFAPSGAIEAGPLRFEIVEGQKSKVESPDTTDLQPSAFRPLTDGSGEAAAVPTTIWASSVDGAPLAASSRILLSHVTDSQNTDAVFEDPGMRIWTSYGRLPALVRRGAAEVSLAVGPGPWKIWRLSPEGLRIAEIPSLCDDTGRLRFTVRTDYDPAAATICYEIARSSVWPQAR